jgi:hypothetical protein
MKTLEHIFRICTRKLRKMRSEIFVQSKNGILGVKIVTWGWDFHFGLSSFRADPKFVGPMELTPLVEIRDINMKEVEVIHKQPP